MKLSIEDFEIAEKSIMRMVESLMDAYNELDSRRIEAIVAVTGNHPQLCSTCGRQLEKVKVRTRKDGWKCERCKKLEDRERNLKKYEKAR